MKNKPIKLFLPSCILATTMASQAAITALSGTGWNQDFVVEKGAGGNLAGIAAATTAGIGIFHYYEEGYNTNVENSTQGLDSTGAYTSTTASYQMQSYTGNNVIQNSGTFTLTTPGKFDTMSFLVTNHGTNNAWTATVNYSDSTNDVLTQTNQLTWTNKNTSPKVISDHGLVRTANTALTFYSANIFITERSLAVDPTKTVESVTFARTSGTDTNLVVWAVSAQPVPEPSSAVLLGLGGLSLILRRRK